MRSARRRSRRRLRPAGLGSCAAALLVSTLGRLVRKIYSVTAVPSLNIPAHLFRLECRMCAGAYDGISGRAERKLVIRGTDRQALDAVFKRPRLSLAGSHARAPVPGSREDPRHLSQGKRIPAFHLQVTCISAACAIMKRKRTCKTTPLSSDPRRAPWKT